MILEFVDTVCPYFVGCCAVAKVDCRTDLLNSSCWFNLYFVGCHSRVLKEWKSNKIFYLKVIHYHPGRPGCSLMQSSFMLVSSAIDELSAFQGKERALNSRSFSVISWLQVFTNFIFISFPHSHLRHSCAEQRLHPKFGKALWNWLGLILLKWYFGNNLMQLYLAYCLLRNPGAWLFFLLNNKVNEVQWLSFKSHILIKA